MAKSRKELNYRFHNPNTGEATADFLVKLFVEVCRPKAEAAIRAAAAETMAGETGAPDERACREG